MNRSIFLSFPSISPQLIDKRQKKTITYNISVSILLSGHLILPLDVLALPLVALAYSWPVRNPYWRPPTLLVILKIHEKKRVFVKVIQQNINLFRFWFRKTFSKRNFCFLSFDDVMYTYKHTNIHKHTHKRFYSELECGNVNQSPVLRISNAETFSGNLGDNWFNVLFYFFLRERSPKNTLDFPSVYIS